VPATSAKDLINGLSNAETPEGGPGLIARACDAIGISSEPQVQAGAHDHEAVLEVRIEANSRRGDVGVAEVPGVDIEPERRCVWRRSPSR
jgi:hypothetical protein